MFIVYFDSVFSLMSFPLSRDVLKEHPRKITLFFTNSQTYYYQSSEIISKKLRGKTITAQQKHDYRILGTALPRTGYSVTTLRLQKQVISFQMYLYFLFANLSNWRRDYMPDKRFW